MCPACISQTAALVAAVVSSGGIAVLTWAKPSKDSTGDNHGTAENRDAR
jgi:hypothetical protein